MTLHRIDHPAALDRRSPAAPFRIAVDPRLRRLAETILARYGLLVGFLVAWQVSSRTGLLNPAVFPPLDTIAAALWQGLVGGALLDDIAISCSAPASPSPARSSSRSRSGSSWVTCGR